MNKYKDTLISAAISAVFVIVILVAYNAIVREVNKGDLSLGAPGNMLIEDYDPYVRYNGGINTALGITNSGTLTQSGASTFSAAVSMTVSETIGASGTAIARKNAGFCNIHAPANTIAATSTQLLGCHAGTSNALSALTGVSAGDSCLLTAPTTTSTGSNGGLVITGVSASSTQGYIDVRVANLTNSTFTWSAAASTSWAYGCNDPA